MRKPIGAGSFYSAYKEKLKKEVKSYLAVNKENIKAVICPHAGYVYSGRLAGEVLGRINNKKDIILLGVNHSGVGGKICFSFEDFETPIGLVKNNKAFGKKILNMLKKEGLNVGIDEKAHEYEHSIEVQLPFLQESQEDFEIIPILLRDLSYEECKKIAGIFSEFVNGDVAIVVSSDMTHYGRNYGFVPFTSNVKEKVFNLDNEIISEILRLKSRLVYEKAGKTTVCGLYGITIITEIAKIKNLKSKLVGYYTSGDLILDYNNFVGYAGVYFY